MGLNPCQDLVLWVIEQGGRVHWERYRAKGMELGCVHPGQNGLFGGVDPLMVSDGEYRVVTDHGRDCAKHW